MKKEGLESKATEIPGLDMSEPPPPRRRSISELHGLLGIALQTGNDDVESPAISALIAGVQNGTIELDEAIVLAQALVDAKSR